MKIAMIAAVAENRVIGRNNDMVWHLPDDMRFFMQKTTGHHVIMGRKNFDSLPAKYKPLPNRVNVVITRQKDLQIEGVHVVNSLEEALEIAKANHEEEAFVIGGGEIYALALEQADTLYITEVKAQFDGDAFFPDFDKSEWTETGRHRHTRDEKHNYEFDFVTYRSVGTVEEKQ